MPTVSFLRSWCLPLCLAACLSCAHANVKVDDDRHPVFNTGVGATILYPGQSPAMPPTHPGHQLPGGAPIPGQPAPAPSGTIGGAPTSTVHRGPGSTASSSGGGGVSFIGGSGVDENTYREIRGEPWWRKYLLAPFAIAAYPFVAVWKAITEDDGPPPAQTAAAPTSPSRPPPAPVDVQTQYEQSQLEALERELAGGAGSQPAPDSLPRSLRRHARPPPYRLTASPRPGRFASRPLPSPGLPP